MPKLFRRRATFAVAAAAGIAAAGPFRNYLEALSQPDLCFETKEFLSAGHAASTQRHLTDFISKADVFTVAAKDLVFNEMPSHVVDANGKPAKW